MTHIFGIEHSISGIVNQLGGLFGGTAAPQGPLQFYPGYQESLGFVPPPGGVVDENFGAGTGGPPYNIVSSGGGCAPEPKKKRFITTVNCDGTITTRPHKSRKRRRRLASVSDIKDLASLKTVLGGGKAFESWIATRGR